jgi:hypothetical protein
MRQTMNRQAQALARLLDDEAPVEAVTGLARGRSVLLGALVASGRGASRWFCRIATQGPGKPVQVRCRHGERWVAASSKRRPHLLSKGRLRPHENRGVARKPRAPARRWSTPGERGYVPPTAMVIVSWRLPSLGSIWPKMSRKNEQAGVGAALRRTADRRAMSRRPDLRVAGDPVRCQDQLAVSWERGGGPWLGPVTSVVGGWPALGRKGA